MDCAIKGVYSRNPFCKVRCGKICLSKGYVSGSEGKAFFHNRGVFFRMEEGHVMKDAIACPRNFLHGAERVMVLRPYRIHEMVSANIQ